MPNDSQAFAFERLDNSTSSGVGNIFMSPAERLQIQKEIQKNSEQNSKDLEDACVVPKVQICGDAKDKVSPGNPGPKDKPDAPETKASPPPDSYIKDRPSPPKDDGKDGGTKEKPDHPPLKRDPCDESWRLKVRPTA